jgi:integrase
MQTKLLTKPIPYTFVRGGYYYFTRRVPTDLQGYYRYPRIVQGLQTSSSREARVLANLEAAKLEAYWSKMRLTKTEVLGAALLSEDLVGTPPKEAERANINSLSDSPRLSEALEMYVSLKGKGRPKTFRKAAERACKYVSDLVGDKPISSYTRHDGLALRDWLVQRGLAGSTVTRNFSYIKAIINFVSSELALDMYNPFAGIYHDRNAGVSSRNPIPVLDILRVQEECLKIDDDLRWLILLISDTGMRLAEGAGLLKSDIILDSQTPYVQIQKHPWRNLKTTSSHRKVPLCGVSLWAAKRILLNENSSKYAFERYNQQSSTSANSASAALNKWLRQYIPEGCTLHSFRHSMRDRLRSVQCPSDIADQIGGWTTSGVGQGYGSGYPLEILHQWIEKAMTL